MRYAALFSLILLVTGARSPWCAGLPVDTTRFQAGSVEARGYGIENLIPLEAIEKAAGAGEKGIVFRFDHLDTLLDGSTLDPASIYGTIFAGPYPFEAEETEYPYGRFRVRGRIEGGAGTLPVGRLLGRYANSEGWTDGGTILVQCDLFAALEGKDRHLGVYDTFVRFEKEGGRFEVLPHLVEGPFIGMVTSDDPTTALVSFRTSLPGEASVLLEGGRSFSSRSTGVRNEVRLSGLTPDTTYRYAVLFAGARTPWRSFRTAPRPGEGEFTFAFSGDSRSGVGSGRTRYMGVNYATLERLMAEAYREDARFLLMGGDLVNGFTTSVADFESQLRAWKEATAGFRSSRPVYTAIGNHEALLRVRVDGKGRRRFLDRWPYATESAEAVFAAEFMNPANGPASSDLRRPPYDETAFSFRYGPVLCIVFNNNYWAVFGPKAYGGSPEGYIMDDQLDWIGKRLDEAQADSTVSHVILCGQEPVFPSGGHVDDAMWYGGDNTVRASTFEGDSLSFEKEGIVEVRNRLVRMIGAHPKVVAVLGSHEHAYHRVRIGPAVPVGVIALDDRDGDNRITPPAERPSPIGDLPHDVWYIVCGGAGAPYYSEESAPWSDYWRATPHPEEGYFYSSQESVLLFHATKETISLRVVNRCGETIDAIDDLRAIR